MLNSLRQTLFEIIIKLVIKIYTQLMNPKNNEVRNSNIMSPWQLSPFVPASIYSSHVFTELNLSTSS